MGKQNNFETPEENDEEMTVTLELDDGTSVTCAIVTILTVRDQDYIVLLPLDFLHLNTSFNYVERVCFYG